MISLLLAGCALPRQPPVPAKVPVAAEAIEQAWEEGEAVVVKHSCPPIREYVRFPRGESEPLAESEAVLAEIIAVMQENPQVRLVEVGGHADMNEGTDAETVALSQQRAESVVALLVAGGVDAERLTAKGYGEHMPQQDGSDERNQRVELNILAQGE